MEGSTQGQGQQGQDPAIAEADRRRATAEADKAVAEARKAATDADAAAADAQQRAVAAYIPDLSRVDRGTLDLKGDQPLLAGVVTQLALDAAARKVVERVRGQLDGAACVLITSDRELAAADAVYAEVVSGIDELSASASALASQLEAKPAPTLELLMLPAVTAGAQVAAAALPAVVSLFSAHRTVTTASATIDDLAAAAAVAGHLLLGEPKPVLVHDDIRLVPPGPVHEKLQALSGERQRLVAARLRLSDRKDDAATAAIAVIDATVAAIDAFLGAIHTVPSGATRSPLTLAALHARLHAAPGSQPPPFTHVLFVRGMGGSTQQAIDDRPLWFNDRFTVLGSAAVTYLLLEVATSAIVVGDTATGTAEVHGKIGDRITFSG